MKMNIRYDEDVPPVSYHTILSKKITEVAAKLNVDVEHIEWFIFEPKKKEKILNTSVSYSVSRYGSDYGVYQCGTKRIGISTTAIRQSAVPMLSATFKLIGLEKGKDILANIIMDELAHEKTRKNHGDKEYDDLLLYYHKKYYGYLF